MAAMPPRRSAAGRKQRRAFPSMQQQATATAMPLMTQVLPPSKCNCAKFPALQRGNYIQRAVVHAPLRVIIILAASSVDR
jgi:hypothetical protein